MTEAAFSRSLAARIRDRRKELRMTQLGLALALGDVARSTVCAWESGERTVSAYDFARIEAIFEQRQLSVIAGAKRRPGTDAAAEGRKP